MTPFLLYCWMVLFVQLLIPSIVYFIVVHTNCNTILSIYLPIILSVALVQSDADGDADADCVAGDPSSGNGTANADAIETTPTGVATSSADSSSKRDTATKTATQVSLRKSNRLKNQSALKENVVNNNHNRRNKVPNEPAKVVPVACRTTSTPPSPLVAPRHQSRKVDSSNSRHSLRQLLLQYWIIVRMVACLGTATTQSIPFWIRRFLFALLGAVGISSTTTSNSILLPHFEFYIYMSVYVIPMITPTVVQEMISAPTTTPKTVPSSTAKTPSKKNHQNRSHTTLIQIY